MAPALPVMAPGPAARLAGLSVSRARQRYRQLRLARSAEVSLVAWTRLVGDGVFLHLPACWRRRLDCGSNRSYSLVDLHFAFGAESAKRL